MQGVFQISMIRIFTPSDREREEIGRCLYLRRRILKLNDHRGNISKQSLIRIIDECLPAPVIKAENQRREKQ